MFEQLEQQWTPLTIFMITWVFSAISGVGQMIYLGEKEWNLKNVLGTIIVFGTAGSSMGMIYHFKFGSKDNPLMAVIIGQLVGIRIIKFQAIAEAVGKIFSHIGETDAAPNRRRKRDHNAEDGP